MADTKFSVMVSLFNWMRKSKSASVRRSKFRKFLDTFCRPNNGGDYFASIRLILPAIDRERMSYGLREHALATFLIEALGISRDSADAQRLLKWRKGGPKSGSFAGNFSLIAAEVLQRRQAMTSAGLTIRQLNDLLDRLATSENRSDKTSVLSELIRKTNAQEMKWIIMIILKDLKLGISEKSIFHEFHPDAEDLFNVTCDLKLVCEKLQDRSQRHKRQDIEVGKPVRPQLALRVSSVAAAWKKLHGKEVVAEYKFDGDRIQIHKNGTTIKFFSRNFLDHPEYEHGMTDVVKENVVIDRCILDGEMLVWDRSLNRFAEFGSNQEIAKAAKEGLDCDRQLCYVAFDILYAGDTSVIHESLKDRHHLLKKVVKPVVGRLEILVPDGGLNLHRSAGEPCCSLLVHDADSVERFFKETVENREEGIVLKDMNSKWEPSDRSGKWLKLKPDYVRAGSDLDVLIIGGYYGTGRHGGEVAQFLVGLSERPAPNTYPRRFVSFCRVGTGLSDEELKAVVTKLKPYFRKNEYPKPPPSFYQVTNNSKERPDVWVESPEKSFLVSITSDIRTIRSEVFAAPYSLRFPRIDQVRYDKPWYECLDVEAFIELVHSANGSRQSAGDPVTQQDGPKRHGVKRKSISVPFHFTQTNVSHVKGETSIFSGMKFYFVNVPSSTSLESLHNIVVENGGTFSMNLNNHVTHCIASDGKGFKFQAAKRQGDVVNITWFYYCSSQKKLVPLQTKYFLHLSDASRKKLEEEIDEFCDSYYLDIDVADLLQILKNVHVHGDSRTVEHYRKKLCPRDEWIYLHGCHIYLHLPRQFLKNKNTEVVLEFAIRRMKNEICLRGGKVADMLSHATHLVVVCGQQTAVEFDTLLNTFSPEDRRALNSSTLQIVQSQWLENCFEQGQLLSESNYSLKPLGLVESLANVGFVEECAEKEHIRPEIGPNDGSCAETVDAQSAAPGTKRLVTLPASRKRKVSVRSSEHIKPVPNRSRTMKPRTRNKPVKIHEHDSDNCTSSDGEKVSDLKPSVRASRRSSHAFKDVQQGATSKPGRKKAHIGNKAIDIGGNDSGDDDTFHLDQGRKEDSFGSEASLKLSTDIPPHAEKCEPKHYESGKHGDCTQEIFGTNDMDSMKESSTNEPTMDPFEAMILSMVPALRGKDVQSSNPATSMAPSPHEVLSSNAGLSTVPSRENEVESSNVDNETTPVKKKKVSYKDMANQLLKDW